MQYLHVEHIHGNDDVDVIIPSEQQQQWQEITWSRLKNHLDRCEGLLYQPLFTDEPEVEHKRFTSDSFCTSTDTGCFDVPSILHNLQATPFGAEVVATLSSQFLQDLMTCVNAKVVEGRHQQRVAARRHGRTYQYIWTHTWQWMRFRLVTAVLWIVIVIVANILPEETLLFLWIWAALYVTVLLLDWRATILRRRLPNVVRTVNTMLASSIHQVYFQLTQPHIVVPWWRRQCCFRKSNAARVAPDDSQIRQTIANAEFKKSNCWFKILLEISSENDEFQHQDLGTDTLQLHFRIGLAATCINCQTLQEQTADDSIIDRCCAQCGLRYQGHAGYCSCEAHGSPTPFCTACGGLRQLHV